MMRRILISCSIIVLCAANSAWGIHFGWQALPEGGIEYIVQVEPDLMDAFRTSGFSSEIPPGLRDVRRIRLVMGEQRLPNQDDVNGPAVSAGAAGDLRSGQWHGQESMPQQENGPAAQLTQSGLDNSAQIALPPPPESDSRAAAIENPTPTGRAGSSEVGVTASGDSNASPGNTKIDWGIGNLLKRLEPGPARHIQPAKIKVESGTGAAGVQELGETARPSSDGEVQPAGDSERAGPAAANTPAPGVIGQSAITAGQQIANPRIGAGELAAGQPARDGFRTFEMLPNGPEGCARPERGDTAEAVAIVDGGPAATVRVAGGECLSVVDSPSSAGAVSGDRDGAGLSGEWVSGGVANALWRVVGLPMVGIGRLRP